MKREPSGEVSATSCCQIQDRRIPGLLIDNILRRLFRPPEKLLRRHLAAGCTAADLGCGPGFFTLPMARIVGESGTVHAVDFDPQAIRKVERKAARRGLARIIELRAASASEIDFVPSESVDFVLAEGLLCCMKDHDGAVRQIKRILKPYGRAYLSVIKFAREGDPRGVSAEEWRSLLAEFHRLEGGEGLLSRWALVTPANGMRSPDEAADRERSLDPVSG